MRCNIGDLRRSAKLTLEALADACGTTKSNLHSLESGRQEPRIGTAYRIARVLGVPVYEVWPDDTNVVEETVVRRRIVQAEMKREKRPKPTLLRGPNGSIKYDLHGNKAPDGAAVCSRCGGLGEYCLGGHSAHPSNWHDCEACDGTGTAAPQPAAKAAACTQCGRMGTAPSIESHRCWGCVHGSGAKQQDGEGQS